MNELSISDRQYAHLFGLYLFDSEHKMFSYTYNDLVKAIHFHKRIPHNKGAFYVLDVLEELQKEKFILITRPTNDTAYTFVPESFGELVINNISLKVQLTKLGMKFLKAYESTYIQNSFNYSQLSIIEKQNKLHSVSTVFIGLTAFFAFVDIMVSIYLSDSQFTNTENISSWLLLLFILINLFTYGVLSKEHKR